MPFLANLEVMLLNDRAKYPWITTAPLPYDSPMLGEVVTVPKHFRTDGASIPKALLLVPTIGGLLFQRYFGYGVWQGFREGVLHDWAIRNMARKTADLLFREALYAAEYPDDLCENYYAAVSAAAFLKD